MKRTAANTWESEASIADEAEYVLHLIWPKTLRYALEQVGLVVKGRA